MTILFQNLIINKKLSASKIYSIEEIEKIADAYHVSTPLDVTGIRINILQRLVPRIDLNY